MVLLPFLGFGQIDVDLATWSLTSNGNMTSAQNYVVKQDGSFTTSQNPINFTTEGAKVTGWNNSDYEHYRYFEMSIAPTVGNLIKISSLDFQQSNSPAGPVNYIAKYFISDGSIPSTDVFFKDATPLIPEESIAGNPNKKIKINQFLSSGEKLIVRFYSKGNDYNNIFWLIKAGTLKFTGHNITQPLHGEYIIGTSPTANFPSISTAVKVLNNVGVDAPVTFLLDEDQITKSQITINQFAGTSPTNTLTIKPNLNKNVSISGKIGSGAIIALNGADNIIIDGNDDHNLTIYNNFDTPNSYTNRLGIWLYGEAQNNKFQNLTIRLNILDINVGTYSTGFYAGSNTIGGSQNNSNNTIANTVFRDVKQAIIIKGSNLSNKNWTIQGNRIGAVDDNSKPFLGIDVDFISEYKVLNNIIDGVKIPPNLGGSTNHSGIYLNNANSGSVLNNKIINIETNRQFSGYGIYCKGNNNSIGQNSIKNLNSASTDNGSCGIRSEGNNTTIYSNDIAEIFSTSSKNTNGIYISGNNQLVFNNFINDVKSNGGGGLDTENGFGIYLNDGEKIKLFYNTIVLKTSQSVGTSAALFIRAGSQIEIINNIFYNAQSLTSYKRYAIYSKVGKTNITINYNDYYSPTIGYLDSDQTTLENWKAATGQDINSKSILPQFVSSTDLHLQIVPANDGLSGIALAGITTDIDGENRVKPYMGADEIFCKLPDDAGDISGSAVICTGTSANYSVLSIANATSYEWTYTGTGVTFSNGTTNTLTINFGTNANSGILTVKGKNNCGLGTVSANFAVTVNPTPVATFTTQPQAQTCAGEHVTYSTQPGQSNYVWTVSGVLGTDYKDIARGTGADHDIVIEWLTGGLRTVTVNYSNSAGCSGVTPASYSTTVLYTDRGQVNGGGFFCEGSPLPVLTLHSYSDNQKEYPYPGLVLKWQQSDDENNANWTDILGTQGIITYSPTPFSGAFRTYRVILKNGPCTKTSIETRVTIKKVIAPKLGAVTQPNCLAPVSSVVLTDLPSSGVIIQTGTVSVNYIINEGGTQTITGLSAGRYQFAVKYDGCISVSTNEVVIRPTENTWNGTTWSDGTPTNNQTLIFNGNYPPAVDPNVNIEGCSCTVKANVTIKSGTYFKIQNGLDVSPGTLTVESDANLIQVNPDAENNGNITVKRDLKFSAARQQYNYLISPVKNVSLTDIYKNAEGGPVQVPFVLYHNEANNKFYTSSGAYIAGRALAVKEATAAAFPVGPGPIMKATFTGKPWNGNLPYTLVNSKPEDSNRGYNLIGNPYPSNLDLVAFYNANSATKALSPTFNLWDSTANSQTTQMGDSYGGQAYAQFNAATPPGSGTGATAPAKGDSALTSQKIPTQVIKVGQGFMAKTAVNGLVVNFSNIMRSGAPTEGFFGKGAQESISFDRYWLNMTSPANITSQIAIVYFEGGDNGYTKEDSRSLGGSDAIYSIVEGQQISINGKNSFTNTDVQPLGSKHFVSGNYTIALGNHLDGVFANGQSIYLKDKQAGIITNLSQGSYTFAATAGESTGRFEIIYQPETVLATEGVKKENLLVYRDGSDFVVKSSTKKITSIQVLDTSGRLILSLQPNEIMARIKADSLSNGMYILRIEQGNQVSAKKIIK